MKNSILENPEFQNLESVLRELERQINHYLPGISTGEMPFLPYQDSGGSRDQFALAQHTSYLRFVHWYFIRWEYPDKVQKVPQQLIELYEKLLFTAVAIYEQKAILPVYPCKESLRGYKSVEDFDSSSTVI